MNILISNDDGIDKAGLLALVKELGRDNKLYVAAPALQQSSAGHRVTVHNTVKVEKRRIEGTVEAWAIYGTPADCVCLAIQELLDFTPDVVISGINRGYNLSTDCVYSGTVAAGLEGLILGVPAMAISLVSDGSYDYRYSAKVAADLLPHYLADPCCHSYLLSVNVPDLPIPEIKGYKVTGFDGTRVYDKNYHKTMIDEDHLEFSTDITDVSMKDSDHTLEGDVTAVSRGYVSISPLTWDMVDHKQKAAMAAWEKIALPR